MKIKLSETTSPQVRKLNLGITLGYQTDTSTESKSVSTKQAIPIGFQLIETKQVNNVPVDGWYGTKQAWFTRTQIGQVLEYDDPNRQVARLHNRHKDRLDPLSVVVKLTTTDGKAYDTFLYSLRGVLEICRWSRQPKANMVMDTLYDMAMEVMEKGYYSTLSDDALLSLLTERTKNDSNLIKKVTIGKRNEHWYNQFEIDNKLQELWNKRFDLNASEYNSELVVICNDYITRYNQEWRKYMRWASSYHKALYESKVGYKIL